MPLSSSIQQGLRSWLSETLPIKALPVDEVLANAMAAKYLGVSERTLKRKSFPNNPNGPRPIRYGSNANLRWSKVELDSYLTRMRLTTEACFSNEAPESNPFEDIYED